MRALYNILFLIGFTLSSPYYFYRLWRRGNWRAGFFQRFGEYDGKVKQSITNRQILWLHAVSVGEMNVCMQVIRALEPRVPNVKIMVSTTTTTGMAGLQKKLPNHIGKIYYPIDRRKFVNRALGSIHPDAVVLVESEIWPNFIWRASNQRIPLFLINARLSDRSYPRYRRFGFFFRKLFCAFDMVGAQTEAGADKLRELGCRPDAIHVIGNLKFDTPALDGKHVIDVPAMLEQLGVAKDAPILVAGSTHDGEEEILAGILRRLRARFPRLLLILVPRHFERAKNVGDMLRKRGIDFAYRTEIKPETRYKPGAIECLLVNTTNELPYFYQCATVTFVGKSLTAKGGQNPIEPADLGKPVIFGPNMQNFADVANIFVDGGGAIRVPNAAALEQAVAELILQPERRAELGRNALRIVQENRGAVARTVDLIVKQLEKRGVYTPKSV